MYVKAARAFQVPVALEVSRSGVGAHAWMFFTAPVPAETARRLGTGLADQLCLRSLLLRRRRTGQAHRSGSAGSRQRRNNEPEHSKA
jgi:hypothetical protein